MGTSMYGYHYPFPQFWTFFWLAVVCFLLICFMPAIDQAIFRARMWLLLRMAVKDKKK